MNKNNSKGFKYAYTPQLIEPKYKYLADWMYKQMKAEFKIIRAGEEVFSKGKYERQWNRRTKYFTASMDENGFYCYEMMSSAAELKNEPLPHTRYNHVSEDCPPALLDIPDYPENDEDEAKQFFIWSTAMQTAIVQLHQEGEFADVVASYPCEIRLTHDNNAYSMGCGGELFLTIYNEDGEIPNLKDLPAIVPDELLCKDCYNDWTLNYIFDYWLKSDGFLKLDNNVLHRIDLEDIDLPTGNFVINNSHITIPAGKHPVKLYLDKNKQTALAAIFLTDKDLYREKAIRFENAATFNVDAKTCSFKDAASKGGAITFSCNNGQYNSYLGYGKNDELYCLVINFNILDEPQDEPKKEELLPELDLSKEMPFPYISAGVAKEYDKLGIYIKFYNAPGEEQRKNIMLNIPQPFRSHNSFDVDILGINWWMGIGNRDIYYCYSEDYKDGDNAFTVECEDGGYTQKTLDPDKVKAAITLFEKYVVRWLLEVNKICPILFVVRGNHNKPGQVTTNNWHKESVKRMPEILSSLTDYRPTELRQRNIFFHMFQMLQRYAKKENVSFDVQLRHVHPCAYTYFSLGQNKFGEVIEAVKASKDEDALRLAEGVCEYLVEQTEFSRYNSKQLYSLCKTMIDVLTNTLLPYYLANANPQVQGGEIYSVISDCYRDIVTKTIVLAASKNDIDFLSTLSDFYKNAPAPHFRWNVLKSMNEFLWQDIVKNKHWQLARKLYAYTLELIPHLGYEKFTESSIYCNALYVCLYDNTHLPIDVDFNNQMLALCMPHVDENYTVYYNAACIYIEMKDYATALNYMKQYFANRKEDWYKDERKRMMHELKTDKAFEEFRQQKEVAEYLDKL